MLIRALRSFIQSRVQNDPELAGLLVELGAWVSREAERARGGVGKETAGTRSDAAERGSRPEQRSGQKSEPVPEVKPVALPGRASLAAVVAPVKSAGAVPLKIADAPAVNLRVEGTTGEIGSARRSVEEAGEVATPTREISAVPDLDVIDRRCRMKAEACGLAIARQENPDDQMVRGKISELITRVKKVPNGVLWMLLPDGARPPRTVQPGIQQMRRLERLFENLGKAVDLVKRTREKVSSEAMKKQALELLAESNSALREAIKDTWLQKPDTDQDETFTYLNLVTSSERVFIGRYMRLDDPANPDDHGDVLRRLNELATKLEAGDKKKREIDKAFKVLRYHAAQIATGEGAEHDWKKLDTVSKDLEERDVSLDDSRWQGMLEELLKAGSQAPEQFGVIRDILADLRGELKRGGGTTQERKDSDDVKRVRAALQGKRVVMVGGERDPLQERAIVERLGFDLEWVELREHASAAPLRQAIQRPGTALVLILVRLSGHHHGYEAKDVCREEGVAFVNLTAGFNPARIAHEIVEQASEKLGVVS